jgi:hypothetical protein
VTFENPYLDVVAGGVTVGAGRAGYADRYIETLRDREELVDEYAWAIPNRPAIEMIVDHDPVLEVGAGTGYWAWCVRQAGGDILPTDLNAPFDDEWVPVWEARGQEVVLDYPDWTLLLVWPPRQEFVATETLGRYEGDTIIYIGEGRGGCTATDRFHEMLHEEWIRAEVVDIPTYLGLRDRLEVWRDPDVVKRGVDQ